MPNGWVGDRGLDCSSFSCWTLASVPKKACYLYDRLGGADADLWHLGRLSSCGPLEPDSGVLFFLHSMWARGCLSNRVSRNALDRLDPASANTETGCGLVRCLPLSHADHGNYRGRFEKIHAGPGTGSPENRYGLHRYRLHRFDIVAVF